MYQLYLRKVGENNIILILPYIYGLNVCLLQIYIFEILTQCDQAIRSFSWKVIRSWAWSPHEWVILPKEYLREAFYNHAGFVKMSICEQGSGLSPNTKSFGTLILDLDSITVGNKCLLLKPSVYGIFAYSSSDGSRYPLYKDFLVHPQGFRPIWKSYFENKIILTRLKAQLCDINKKNI